MNPDTAERAVQAVAPSVAEGTSGQLAPGSGRLRGRSLAASRCGRALSGLRADEGRM
nr:hypothetical protein [Solirubrobacterales bacterium]